MDKASQIQRIRSALAQGQGVLVLGPLFDRNMALLDTSTYFDGLFESISDGSGWENTDFQNRLRIASTDMGEQKIRDELAELLPSAEALIEHVRPFQKQLINLPFSAVIDLAFHDLSSAVIRSLDQQFRFLASDSDLVSQSQRLPGEKDLLKLRGDLWLDESAITLEGMRQRIVQNPAIKRHIQKLVSDGPVVFYGFLATDPMLRFFYEMFSPLSGITLLCTQLSNRVWTKYWRKHGLQVIDAATANELEDKVSTLCDSIQPASDLPSIQGMLEEVGDVVARHLAQVDILQWVRRPRSELDSLTGSELLTISQSIRLMAVLSENGLPVPARPAAYAAEVCIGAGNLPAARQTLGIAVHTMSNQVQFDHLAMAAVGRTLNRMGDGHRAAMYLRRALHSNHDDQVSQADDFAWLSRSVLQRIDNLRAAGRRRAVIELVAGFLKDQASFLSLSQIQTDDEEFQRSIYYINLRLGRLMGLASEMAENSASVYASQAIELLTRAIVMMPAKPDGYKAIRPLLTDRHYPTVDTKRWMALVASAPPAVQRRLGGR